jgi:hypothetical protein
MVDIGPHVISPVILSVTDAIIIPKAHYLAMVDALRRARQFVDEEADNRADGDYEDEPVDLEAYAREPIDLLEKIDAVLAKVSWKYKSSRYWTADSERVASPEDGTPQSSSRKMSRQSAVLSIARAKQWNSQCCTKPKR